MSIRASGRPAPLSDRFAKADAELRNLNAVAYPRLRQTLLALSTRFGLPSTQFKLAMRSARRGAQSRISAEQTGRRTAS